MIPKIKNIKPAYITYDFLRAILSSYIFVVFAFVFFSTIASGQSLCGNVTDSTGTPIFNAHVRVLNSSTQAQTDSSGFFCIKFPTYGVFTLAISASGYATSVLPVRLEQENQNIEIHLQEKFTTLEAVLITAEKKEELLHELPASVSCLTSERIQQTQTWELKNLTCITPNFQYADAGVGYQQQLAIRGVSVFSENPTVATYIDGVNALDISANALQMADVERIEVLRGPQGTLYGRNAMAGVINIITRRPTNETSLRAEASLGNQGLQRYMISAQKPLRKDRFYSIITAQFQRRHGYYYSDTSLPFSYLGRTFYGTAPVGIRLGDENSLYANLSLRYMNGPFSIFCNSKIQYDYSTGASNYFQAAVDDSFAFANPYKVTINRFGNHKRFVSNNALVLTKQFSRFSASSSYAYQFIGQAYDNIDFDYWSYDVAYAASYFRNTGDFFPQHVFSNEIRISSNENQKRLKWTAGTYFFHQVYLMRTATVYIPPLSLFFGYSDTDVSQSDRRNTGLAAFAQSSYLITPSLEFTLGLRYDYENKKSYSALYNINNSGQATFKRNGINKQKAFHAALPKFVVKYNISPNQHFYVSYARGYRAGGINMFTDLSDYETFDPEYSDNYEAGYKMFSTTRKVMLSFCLFFMDWYNMQLEYRPTGSNSWVTDNIGNVKSNGAELEITIKPLPLFKTDASIGLNDARYKDFQYIGIPIRNHRTILAPDVTAYVSPQYSIPLIYSRKQFIILQSEWRYTGTQYFDLANKLVQPAYHIFNGRIALRTPKTEIALWIQNIADQRYILYAPPAYFRYTLLARPRTWGITLNKKF
ncbi:MAG: TonB-dependent receptor [Cytophagaceae bacterium]|nr:TonB-dependent receptor [Cytophagaceae bacterium]MDW8455448.1 TonB-dependent receptor [Cytophagaceae bacterium]